MIVGYPKKGDENLRGVFVLSAALLVSCEYRFGDWDLQEAFRFIQVALQARINLERLETRRGHAALVSAALERVAPRHVVEERRVLGVTLRKLLAKCTRT